MRIYDHRSRTVLVVLWLFVGGVFVGASRDAAGRAFHVSPAGADTNDGTPAAPLKTISAATKLAQAGDTITVHEGVYRERIDPPRGGTSENKRIVYQAAAGEKVVIKGSEIVKEWRRFEHDTWKATLPPSFFGDFNPFADEIRGDWFNGKGRVHHTGAVYLNGHWLGEAVDLKTVVAPAVESQPLWFAQVDDTQTTIWAQFPGVDPNQETVEVNVRQAVFYPSQPGRNFITVRGFTLEQAAPNWAPPTAEQVGLIGVHWSKGWLIEDNTIRYSACTGLTLGKHGDEYDNTSSNTAEGYVETIKRARQRGWSKENIGHHIVRNNRISHCEQAGIVGSMGAAFSEVSGNTIHDVFVRRWFGGAEMAGIKFHGAIDTIIRSNHIYRSGTFGIWLDWMTQGTRVTGNLLHDNKRPDLFVEVNHGPFLVDHNILLSPSSILDWSQGGAFVHNLIAGRMMPRREPARRTPYHPAHSTEVAGLHGFIDGDDRFYNNLFVGGSGLAPYDTVKEPLSMAGNVFLLAAKPSRHEKDALSLPEHHPSVKLEERSDGVYLSLNIDQAWGERQRPLVTTELLGKAAIPKLPFVQPDGSPYRLDCDYFGNRRDAENPFPGPVAGGAAVKTPWMIRNVGQATASIKLKR